MMSTLKRISKAGTALLIFATLTIVSTHAKQHQQDQIETNPARNMGDDGDVPLDVIENMDPKLIDFVVGGFPKCGTTYLQNKILYPSKRVFIPHHETHFLQNDLYEEFKGEFANVTDFDEESGKPLVSGYKAPFELGHHKSLRNLAALFPDVRMIITLRHPITQFESLYNYKLRKLPQLVPPVDEYVGYCLEQCPSSTSESSPSSGAIKTMEAKKITQRCVKDVTFCTGQTNYHQYLSRLGLTPMNTPEEWDLLDHHDMSIHRMPGWQKESSTTTSSSGQQSYIRSPGWNDELSSNEPYRREDSSESNGHGRGHGNGNGKLFLLDVKQFDNRVNQSMADDLNTDLETFLGLDYRDLPRAPPRSGDKKPKPEYEYPSGREDQVLDICLEKFKPLREVLLESSRKASKWIMEYLLHPSNRDRVIVSNMDIFERMLEGWKVDPCLERDEMNE
jgi:hypothetical protein